MNAERKLIDSLHEISKFLKENGEAPWSSIIDQGINRVADNSVNGAQDVLELFGGVGTLNDVVIYKDGNPSSPLNIEFDRLRDIVYSTAKDVAHP